jgi:hypothetical protein
MAWEIKDEWIDLAQGHHKVIFHNPDVLVEGWDNKPRPVEHHLTHDFRLVACPHCGNAKAAEGEPLDFAKVKKQQHEALKAHHKKLMEYREKHPKVRIGSGPK